MYRSFVIMRFLNYFINGFVVIVMIHNFHHKIKTMIRWLLIVHVPTIVRYTFHLQRLQVRWYIHFSWIWNMKFRTFLAISYCNACDAPQSMNSITAIQKLGLLNRVHCGSILISNVKRNIILICTSPWRSLTPCGLVILLKSPRGHICDIVHTMRPVYKDHLMEYFSAFWGSSRWPRAT